MCDGDAKAQSRAAAVVQRMPPQGDDMIALLRALLKKPETAFAAISALQQQGPAARAASAELAAFLAPNKVYGFETAQALGAIGNDETAVARLEQFIRAGGQPKRYAAMALGGGGPGAAELLRPLLTDSDSFVRNSARSSLTRIESMSRLEAKRQALKAAADVRTRFYAAADVLRLDPRDETAALVVVRELRGEDQRLRDHAVADLMSARPPSFEVLRFLLDAVEDAELDAEVKTRCQRIIAHLARATAAELGISIPDVIATPRNSPPEANYVRLPMPERTRPQVPEESIQCGIRFLTPKAERKDSRPVLVLERAQDLGTVKPGGFRGLLARELIRQAVLLTAREELGLLTRDLTLRETFEETFAFTLKVELGLVMIFRPGANVRVSLVRRSGPNEPLWQKQLSLATVRPFDYVGLAEGMERCAREEWPAVFRQAGVTGPAPQAQVPAVSSPKRVELPAGVEEKLNTMSFLVQFAALRELDQLRRTQGQSPELLGGLVRAYANLGLLTDFHHTIMDRAYRARALLYAQRLLAVAPDFPVGRWHRAFACALAGLPAAALADLAEADRLEKARKENASALTRPSWTNLIDSYCRFDTAALEKVGDSQLARLLGFRTIEHPSTKALTIKTGRALLKDNPECYHVIDALCTVGGVSLLHKVTQLGPAVLLQTLPHRLRQMPNLPGEVTAELAAGKIERLDEVQLLRVLEEAGSLEHDTAEPAWSSLAWLLRETRFVQLMRRVEFMKGPWAVPVRDYVQQALPLLADHPLQPLFELMGLEKNTARNVASAKECSLGAWCSAPRLLAGALPFIPGRCSMGACRLYSAWDRSGSTSIPAMGANCLTSMLNGMTARRNSGSIPSGWSGATDSAEKRSTESVNWSRSIEKSYWRVGMSSSTVEAREALAIHVEVSDDTLSVELSDGRTIAAPLAWYPRLAHASTEERETWRLLGGGRGIHWPEIDEDISVANLLAGQPSAESQSSFKKWLASRAKPSRGRKRTGAERRTAPDRPRETS